MASGSLNTRRGGADIQTAVLLGVRSTQHWRAGSLKTQVNGCPRLMTLDIIVWIGKAGWSNGQG